MDVTLAGLNGAQRSAVTSQASVLQVLAGPGSGKTKVTTTRVLYLIAAQKLQPWNIIVCTFTVKAAKEMQSRIEAMLGSELSGKIQLGTFHSIARRFLVKFGKLIGLDPGFGIADESDRKALVEKIIKRKSLTIKPTVAISRMSAAKAEGQRPQVQIAKSEKGAGARQAAEEFAEVCEEYAEELKRQNLLDYDDLLVKCLELLRGFPNCVENIEAVLVDEFQDTNNTQYELMKVLAQKRRCITVVGDPDQSIYGWRSAKVENLTKMKNYYQDVQVVNLEENYRSSSLILRTAQELIDQDTGRPQKTLLPTRSIGFLPTLRMLDSAATEACWIVMELQRIRHLLAGLISWDDCAILLRSASLSRPTEIELNKAGIPYRMVGGRRFYDRVEVKIILDYLRVIDNPNHSEALLRILNKPSRKIGELSEEVLVAEAHKEKITVWYLILGVAQGRRKLPTGLKKQCETGITNFVGQILRAQKKLADQQDMSLTEFVEDVLRHIELGKYLKEQYGEQSDAKWANVEELLSQATDVTISFDSQLAELAGEDYPSMTGFEKRKHALRLFLSNTTLANASEEKESEKENGTVTISTMHAAKGLEWPVVFVPCAYQGSIPHSRAEDTEEERRLLYVAFTRAQALLYSSCPLKDSRGNTTSVSEFLTHKGVKSCVSQRGPLVDFDSIHETSKILGRACPQASLVQQRKMSIEFVEDNYFRQEGSVNEQDENDAQPSNLANGTKYQHRTERFGATKTFSRDSVFSVKTTMQSQSSFSVAQAPYSSFSTAKSLYHTHSTTDKANSVPEDRTAQNENAPKRQKLAGKGFEGQQTLMSFWRKPAPCKSLIPAREEKQEAVTSCRSRPPLRDISSSSLPEVSVKNEHEFAEHQPAKVVGAPSTAALRLSLQGWPRSHRQPSLINKPYTPPRLIKK